MGTDKIQYDEEVDTDSLFPEYIRTERLYLEKLCPDNVGVKEAHDLYSSQDDDVWKYVEYEQPGNFGQVASFLEKAEEKWKEGTEAHYLIRLLDDTPIGEATFENVDWEKNKTSIGIWLDKEYWGRGIAGERAHAMFEVAFNHLGLDVIRIKIISENEKSVRAVEKYMEEHGGQHGGTLKNEHKLDGEIHDAEVFSITAEQYNSE